MLAQRAATGGGATFATFDSGKRATQITLSLGNTRATITSDADRYRVGAQGPKTPSATVRAVEFEVVSTGGGYLMLGWMVSTLGVTGNFDISGLNHYADAGLLVDQGGYAGGFPTYTAGDRIGTTLSLVSGQAVFRWFKNGTFVGQQTNPTVTARRPSFGGYYTTGAVNLITDPAAMTHFASYGATAGWTNP